MEEEKKEIEEAKKFLKTQGVDVAELEKEHKEMKERLKKVERRVQSAESELAIARQEVE